MYYQGSYHTLLTHPHTLRLVHSLVNMYNKHFYCDRYIPYQLTVARTTTDTDDSSNTVNEAVKYWEYSYQVVNSPQFKTVSIYVSTKLELRAEKNKLTSLFGREEDTKVYACIAPRNVCGDGPCSPLTEVVKDS